MAHPRAQSAPRAPPRGGGGVVHHLYVLVIGNNAQGENDHKSRALTLAILKYVHDRLPVFTKMGVKIQVHKVKKSDLGNARLVDAMKRRGITSLPALVTPLDTYVGNRTIGQLYESNISEFKAYLRRGAEAPTGFAPDDDLSNYYREVMVPEDEDALGNEDEIIGEGGDMMDSYRQMMQRRKTRSKQGSKPGQTTPQPKRNEAPARRPDNVSGGSGGSGDATMDSLIHQMAGDIDAQTLEKSAFASSGDSLDLDGGSNAADDLMEMKYWANQELSM